MQLMSALHNLAYSLESPDDTISRYGAMVRRDLTLTMISERLTSIHAVRISKQLLFRLESTWVFSDAWLSRPVP